jgi:hypothetical protein
MVVIRWVENDMNKIRIFRKKCNYYAGAISEYVKKFSEVAVIVAIFIFEII